MSLCRQWKGNGADTAVSINHRCGASTIEQPLAQAFDGGFSLEGVDLEESRGAEH